MKWKRNEIKTSCKFSYNLQREYYRFPLLSKNVMSASFVGFSHAPSHFLWCMLQNVSGRQSHWTEKAVLTRNPKHLRQGRWRRRRAGFCCIRSSDSSSRRRKTGRERRRRRGLRRRGRVSCGLNCRGWTNSLSSRSSWSPPCSLNHKTFKIFQVDLSINTHSITPNWHRNNPEEPFYLI